VLLLASLTLRQAWMGDDFGYTSEGNYDDRSPPSSDATVDNSDRIGGSCKPSASVSPSLAFFLSGEKSWVNMATGIFTLT
jgi:hypothetical protein